MEERTTQIFVRVTPQEKKRIAANAKKCGLSVSEYIRQRSLGFAPREVPPKVYYEMCGKLEKAMERPEYSHLIPVVLGELRAAVLFPGRDL